MPSSFLHKAGKKTGEDKPEKQDLIESSDPSDAKDTSMYQTFSPALS